MNDWVKRIEELERKVKMQRADLLIEMTRRDIAETERDRYKQLYEDLLSTNEVLKEMTTRKN